MVTQPYEISLRPFIDQADRSVWQSCFELLGRSALASRLQLVLEESNPRLVVSGPLTPVESWELTGHLPPTLDRQGFHEALVIAQEQGLFSLSDRGLLNWVSSILDRNDWTPLLHTPDPLDMAWRLKELSTTPYSPEGFAGRLRKVVNTMVGRFILPTDAHLSLWDRRNLRSVILLIGYFELHSRANLLFNLLDVPSIRVLQLNGEIPVKQHSAQETVQSAGNLAIRVIAGLAKAHPTPELGSVLARHLEHPLYAPACYSGLVKSNVALRDSLFTRAGLAAARAVRPSEQRSGVYAICATLLAAAPRETIECAAWLAKVLRRTFSEKQTADCLAQPLLSLLFGPTQNCPVRVEYRPKLYDSPALARITITPTDRPAADSVKFDVELPDSLIDDTEQLLLMYDTVPDSVMDSTAQFADRLGLE